MFITDLTNEQLLSSLHTVVGEERRLVAKLLAYLGEVEQRGLHLDAACPTIFVYCTRKLGFSDDQAGRRVHVARLGRRFPQVLDAIAAGQLTLSSADLLRPHVDESNIDELLALASGMSKSEVLHFIAKLAPKRDVADSVQLVAQQGELAAAMSTTASGPSAIAFPSTPVSAQLAPLSEDRYQVTFTASTVLREKLERARALMRHRNPNGDLASVVERALDLLIDDLEKVKLGKTKRPRKSKGSADPGHVTRETRREVIERDAEQCTFVSADGERCPAREFLELDHEHPRALGGAGDTANIQIRCRAHNQRAADKIFGREHMEAKRHPRQRGRKTATERTTAAEPITPAPSPAAIAKTATHENGASVVHIVMAPRESALSHTPAASVVMDDLDAAPSRPTAPVVPDVTPLRAAADPRPPREIVRSALVGMGFRDKDAERALQAVSPSEWSRPIEALVRDAIVRLT